MLSVGVNMLWYILATLCLAWALKKWLDIRRISKMLPPSIPGLPVIGSLLNPEKIHVELHRLSKQFGDIFTVWTFGTPSVMVNSANLFEQVHKIAKNRIAYTLPTYKLICAGGKSILFGDATDPEWKYIRQVTFKALKSYGSLLKELEELINCEVDSFLGVLQETEGQAMEPSDDISITLGCIISTLMFGERLGRDHPDIRMMRGLVLAQTEVTQIGLFSEVNIFPWLQHFNTPVMKKIHSFHRKRDQLLDCYLQRYRANNLSGGLIELLMKAEGGGLTDDQIKADFVDLLLGGISTTYSTSLAFILLLMQHNDEQEKVHEEIDRAIGRSRSPKLSDMSEMPCLQAALMETLRFITPVPMSGRASENDIEIDKYHIPANIQFYTNVWSVCHDETFWNNPYEWNPSRFLDEDGSILPSTHPKRKRLDLEFGTGNRICPGKHFAMVRLFLLFAAMLQKFDIRCDPANPPPVLEPEELIKEVVVLIPKYHVCFIPRY